MKKYKLSGCGGTFDRLHQGHRDFLQFVFSLSEEVVIGLTSDTYILQFKSDQGIEPFEVREKALEDYLKSQGQNTNATIVSIDDKFGPTVTSDYPFDALVVTETTRNAAELINAERQKRGMLPLVVEVFTLSIDEKGTPYSSSRIRETLYLTSPLRMALHEPFGELLQDIPGNVDSDKIITVGDITTKKFINKQILPRLAIVDFMVERKKIPTTDFIDREVVKVKNPPGEVSTGLQEAVEKAFQANARVIIIVDGEEDLAVIPVLLYAPLGFSVFYGQPGKGLVKVDVTQKIKDKVKKLVSQFDTTASV